MVIVCKHLIDHVSWWIDLLVERKYVSICIRQNGASQLRVGILTLLVHTGCFTLWFSKLHSSVLIVCIVSSDDRCSARCVTEFRVIAELIAEWVSVDMVRVAALLQISIPLRRNRLSSYSIEGRCWYPRWLLDWIGASPPWIHSHRARSSHLAICHQGSFYGWNCPSCCRRCPPSSG